MSSPAQSSSQKDADNTSALIEAKAYLDDIFKHLLVHFNYQPSFQTHEVGLYDEYSELCGDKSHDATALWQQAKGTGNTDLAPSLHQQSKWYEREWDSGRDEFLTAGNHIQNTRLVVQAMSRMAKRELQHKPEEDLGCNGEVVRAAEWMNEMWPVQ